MVAPEPVAVITEGLEVTDVSLDRDTMCAVKVEGGRTVLDIGLIAYPGEQLAVRQAGMMCRGGEFSGPDKSCDLTFITVGGLDWVRRSDLAFCDAYGEDLRTNVGS